MLQLVGLQVNVLASDVRAVEGLDEEPLRDLLEEIIVEDRGRAIAQRVRAGTIVECQLSVRRGYLSAWPCAVLAARWRCTFIIIAVHAA
eukprot:scaffold17838_cov126-Isochrysis_galbana.AAC.1